jgi:alpha-beta hydrolase superfamily lysophospholipase
MPDASPATTGEHLSLWTADDVGLAASWWEPSGEARATAVLVHGFTAHQGERHVVATREALLAAGVAVLTYDSRGHGRSEGTSTLGDDERFDVAAAVACARRRSHRPIVVIGASMGAIAALNYAAGDADLGGVVILSCPARWRLHGPATALAALMTHTPPGRLFLARRAGVRVHPKPRGPEPRHAAAACSAPLAVVHGTADRFMPTREARELYAHASGTRRLDLVAGMGHAYGSRATPAVLAAMEWTLATKATAITGR